MCEEVCRAPVKTCPSSWLGITLLVTRFAADSCSSSLTGPLEGPAGVPARGQAGGRAGGPVGAAGWVLLRRLAGRREVLLSRARGEDNERDVAPARPTVQLWQGCASGSSAGLYNARMLTVRDRGGTPLAWSCEDAAGAQASTAGYVETRACTTTTTNGTTNGADGVEC